MMTGFPVGNSSAEGPDIEGSAGGDVGAEIDESVGGSLVLAGCSGGQKFSDEDAGIKGSASGDKCSTVEGMVCLTGAIYPDALIPGA